MAIMISKITLYSAECNYLKRQKKKKKKKKNVKHIWTRIV